MNRVKMSMFLMIVVVTLFGAAGAFSQTRTPALDKRERNQQHRINQGVKSGKLTRAEAGTLERQEARIKTQEMFAKKDGQVTAAEHRKLHRELNHESHRIYRKKHNGRTQS